MEAVRPYKKQVMPSLKPENFNYFLLVTFKNMLEDMTTLHRILTTIYCITKQQRDDGSLFTSRRQSCYINYRASHEKSMKPTANKRSSMKTIVFALKNLLTVKLLIACS